MSALAQKLLRTFTSTSPSNLERRKVVAFDTIKRSNAIIQERATEGATIDSVFLTFDELLHAQNAPKWPDFPPSKTTIVNSDAFTAAREIMQKIPDAHGKTTVLNLASDEIPGGGWNYSLAKTQEEALCYSSTLFATLKPDYYPWPNIGKGSSAGIFSPGVVIFKHDLDHSCVDLSLKQRRVVSVITVAAPRHRPLSDDLTAFKEPGVLEDLRGKIRLVYRMAAHHGQHFLVLGAMGCGVYRCPPELVAREMKSILDSEFRGWFRQVVFAVYSKGGNNKNFDIFRKVFSAKPTDA